MTRPFVLPRNRHTPTAQRKRNAKAQRTQRLLAVWREQDAKEKQ